MFAMFNVCLPFPFSLYSFHQTAKNSIYTGQHGNLCHVDCANRGICNYKTGVCSCFPGQYGQNCAVNDPDATYEYWNKDMDVLWV